MDYRYFIIPVAILLLIIVLLIIFHLKKKAAIRKVKALTPAEKDHILDTLGEPVGYAYNPRQDIFASRLDAPQKLFGYATLYDIFAPYFNMVFDYETIYFNYKDRTWLIEMWKGQYGINAGCELGIYYADRILKPEEYDFTLFKAVDDKDMLDISLKLNHCTTKSCRQYSNLGRLHHKHWWLTIFNMGTFAKPGELFVNTAITFKDYDMLRSFITSFRETLPDTDCKTSGLTVYFTFFKSARRYSLFRKMVRRLALISCRIYTRLFNNLTKPFETGGDKLLYIYYYLPFAIRLIFKQKHLKKL